jgi:hypothetical protein
MVHKVLKKMKINNLTRNNRAEEKKKKKSAENKYHMPHQKEPF